MHRFVSASLAVVCAAFVACSTQGPVEEESNSEAATEENAQGGSDAEGGAEPAASAGGQGGAPSTSSSGDGGEDEPKEPPNTCSIMASNGPCKSCLEESCCMVVHACLDEDLLGCVACLDALLSGDGPDACDQTVGKNDWLVECVAFNCEDECG